MEYPCSYFAGDGKEDTAAGLLRVSTRLRSRTLFLDGLDQLAKAPRAEFFNRRQQFGQRLGVLELLLGLFFEV